MGDFQTDLDPDSFRVKVEYDPQRQGFPMIVTAAPKLPAHFGMILSDAIHNMRSALDQVAWAMVERGAKRPDTLPEGARRRIAFPLCDHELATDSKDSTAWDATCRSKLPGVTGNDLRLVYDRQPFQKGARDLARLEPLYVLGDLDNLNKHRTVQPVIHWPTAAHIQILDWHDCDPPDEPQVTTTTSVDVGAELGFISVRNPGSNPKLDANPIITVEPIVNERILVWKILHQSNERILFLLRELANPPPEIETLGVTDVTI